VRHSSMCTDRRVGRVALFPPPTRLSAVTQGLILHERPFSQICYRFRVKYFCRRHDMTSWLLKDSPRRSGLLVATPP
jgi:hypothetical protein